MFRIYLHSLLLRQTQNPPFTFCMLICRFHPFHCTNPSPVMHVFVVCVCVCVCACACVCVCVCVTLCRTKIFVKDFVNASGYSRLGALSVHEVKVSGVRLCALKITTKHLTQCVSAAVSVLFLCSFALIVSRHSRGILYHRRTQTGILLCQ